MKSLKHLNKYFVKYKFKMLIGIVFVILANISELFIPYLVRVALDYGQFKLQWFNSIPNESIQNNVAVDAVKMALIFGGLILLAALLKGIFLYFMRQTIILASRYMEYDLKNEIYLHYQKMDATFYRKNFTGDLMNRISEDVSAVRMYLGPSVMYTINLFFKFIMVVTIMFSINTELSIYVLLPLPILAIIIYFVSNIINRKSTIIQEKLSNLTSFVQESFSGIRILKSYGVENYFFNQFEEQSETYRKSAMSLAMVQSLFVPMIMLLVGVSNLITIYFGGIQVIEGKLTFGNIAEFVIYVNMLTWPVAAVGWVSALVQKAAASQTRINEFLDTKSDIVSGGKALGSIEKGIELKNVSFTFPERNLEALSDINLYIPKGTLLGVVGKTGSGKTTLLNILLRTIDPSKGKVWVDNEDIKNIQISDYRKLLGIVPQDSFLFSDSIKNNIEFGLVEEKLNVDTKTKRVEAATKLAVIHNEILGFKDGYETLLGERGINLSGGQKQRLTIARAIIRDVEFLVMDDSLSAVDQATEQKIIRNIKTYLKGKTGVVVSHRVHGVSFADNIIVMDKGKIIEQGTHKELLALNGEYAELDRKQKN